MLQHRHVYPGLKGDEVLGWHDASRVHTKYPTAHDSIYEEREVADKAAPVAEPAPDVLTPDEEALLLELAFGPLAEAKEEAVAEATEAIAPVAKAKK